MQRSHGERLYSPPKSGAPLTSSRWAATILSNKEKSMLTSLQVGDNARWKQRFRAPVIVWTQVALANPTRGLTINNTTGTFQLYAWDVPSGALRQLTERPAGILFGALSGDGRYVYYLDDQQGNEIGHFVRIPFEGGEPQDLTPNLPPYSSFAFASSGSAHHFGFMTADTEGFHIYSLETRANGECGMPHQLFHSRKLTLGPTYSYGGEIAVVPPPTAPRCNTTTC
jgi:hypothetical protein